MKQKILFIMIIFGLLFGTVLLFQQAEPVHAYVTTAFDVKFTHWDPWYEPHYGAYFVGSNGFSQYYTGINQHPYYGSFNWWGSSLNVLLLNKTWLFNYTDPWVASNHHAYF